MKNYLRFFVISFFLIFSSATKAQSNFGVGINLGGGSFGGNLTTQTGFASSFFIEANPGFSRDLIFRISFVYITDSNILFPQNPNRNYPFIKCFTLKGIESQKILNNLYLEEGLGLLFLNDRTFENINEWDFGAAFSILPGIDFRDELKRGFKLGVGTEYGLTFTNTNVWYFSIHLQTEFYF